MLGNTQGLSTQSSSSNPEKFTTWCTFFLREYNKRFVEQSNSSTQEDDERFRKSFVDFLVPNLAENGKRYKSMFRELIKESAKDNGTLCYNFVKAFFDLMVKYNVNEQHRIYFLQNLLKVFEVDELDPGIAFDFEILYKEEVLRISSERIQDVYSLTLSLFEDQLITKKRSIKLFVWLSTVHNKETTNKAVLEKLFNKCSQEAINGVVGVICDDDQIAVFHSFTEKFLDNGFTRDTSYQKLGFAKITACLRSFSDPEIEDIIKSFCEAWSENDSDFLNEIGDEIAEFIHVLHRHPTVGKAAVKVFKKHKKFVRSSVFGLICQIGLISSYRYEEEISRMLSSSLSKIWQFADNLETDGWIYTMIKDLQLRKIKAKFDVIIDFIKDCPNAADELAKGLTVLSIQLIESSSKKASFNIIGGKLDRIENDISFIGRRLLVDTILAIPIEIDKKYSIEPLEALVTAICTNASKMPTVYFFIDVLVELRNKNSGLLVMIWEVFDKLAKNICEFPSEVGVKIMSALMPVIIQRDGLRNDIFNGLKKQMVSVTKVSTALPVMFQLLRSLVEQPETKSAFQCSQSFASFSSQLARSHKSSSSSVLDTIPIIECIKRCMHQSPATKCLVYKGIVDIVKKNNFFVIHGLDLLLHELTALPKLDASTYVVKRNDAYYLKYQCPQLLKATHAILAAASESCENVAPLCFSQLSQNGKETVGKATTEINKYIETIVDADLEDLKLDEVSFSSPPDAVVAIQFGTMMVQLFDVSIECLWDFKSSGIAEETVKKVEKLILRRKILSDLLEEKTKPEKGSKTKKEAKPKSKVVKNSKAKKESLDFPKFVVQDVQIDIPKLSSMLEDLDLPLLENRSTFGDLTFKDVLLPWLLFRIHDSVNLLNSKSSTCLTSLKSLTSMACSLLKFFSSTVPSSAAPEAIKAFVIAQTKAVESYSKILVYILSKYQGKCALPLKEIYERVISQYDDEASEYPQYTQHVEIVAEVAQAEIDHAESDNAAGLDKDFRIFSSKHIAAYYQKILAAIFATRGIYESRKTVPEYHKQICSFLNVARKLTSMLTSSSNNIRVNVFKLIMEIADKYKIGDKNTTNEFWKGMLEIIGHSNCNEYWIRVFNDVVKSLICIVKEERSLFYPSLEKDVAPQFYVSITRTISYLLAKVRTAINVKLEIGEEIDDDFLATLCCTVDKFAENIFDIIKIDCKFVTENEQMVTGAVEMLTEFYATLNFIAQQFKTKVIAKIDIDDWQSLNDFDRLICNTTDAIVKESSNKFGRGNYVMQQASKSTKSDDAKKAEEKAKKQQSEFVRRNKKDERLFVRLDKEFELFHGTLIIIEGKYGNENRPLTLKSINEKAMRVFKIDVNALAQRFGTTQRNNESCEEEEENDESDQEDEDDADKSEEENDKSDDSGESSEHYDY